MFFPLLLFLLRLIRARSSRRTAALPRWAHVRPVAVPAMTVKVEPIAVLIIIRSLRLVPFLPSVIPPVVAVWVSSALLFPVAHDLAVFEILVFLNPFPHFWRFDLLTCTPFSFLVKETEKHSLKSTPRHHVVANRPYRRQKLPEWKLVYEKKKKTPVLDTGRAC